MQNRYFAYFSDFMQIRICLEALTELTGLGMPTGADLELSKGGLDLFYIVIG